MPGPFRVSLVTLGVEDVPRAAAFYEALGMRRSSVGDEEVAFLDAGDVVLSLFKRARLAQEARVENTPPGFGGFSLAFNVEAEEDVAAALARAAAAGATILKPAERAFWGGTVGYFADPEGHVWEVAHNPGFPLVQDRVRLPN